MYGYLNRPTQLGRPPEDGVTVVVSIGDADVGVMRPGRAIAEIVVEMGGSVERALVVDGAESSMAKSTPSVSVLAVVVVVGAGVVVVVVVVVDRVVGLVVVVLVVVVVFVVVVGFCVVVVETVVLGGSVGITTITAAVAFVVVVGDES